MTDNTGASAGMASRGPDNREPVGLLLPTSQYNSNKEMFDQAGAVFEARSSDMGYLTFPRGTLTWSCPVVQFPNGRSFVLITRGSSVDRMVIAGVADRIL